MKQISIKTRNRKYKKATTKMFIYKKKLKNKKRNAKKDY